MDKKLGNVVTKPILKKEIDRLEKKIVQALVLLKGIEKETKNASKVSTRLDIMQKQLTELNEQMTELAKVQKGASKKPRKLSEMNIFVREQIKSGKSFTEAIQAWKDYKATKQSTEAEAEKTEESAP